MKGIKILNIPKLFFYAQCSPYKGGELHFIETGTSIVDVFPFDYVDDQSETKEELEKSIEEEFNREYTYGEYSVHHIYEMNPEGELELLDAEDIIDFYLDEIWDDINENK